jgi:hypothetical protein
VDDKWTVYDYEVDMFKATHELSRSDYRIWHSRHVNNAIAESLLLHTRILSDILLSRNNRDLNLKKLLPDFNSSYLDELRSRYGDADSEHSPCWTLNKMLAHPTSYRSDSFDCTSLFDEIKPAIYLVLEEVDNERKKRGEGQIKRPDPSRYVRAMTSSDLSTSSS